MLPFEIHADIFIVLEVYDESLAESNTERRIRTLAIIVKFLQDKWKYCKRRAKISADISAHLFQGHV